MCSVSTVRLAAAIQVRYRNAKEGSHTRMIVLAQDKAERRCFL